MPQLLTVEDAAELMRARPRTLRAWAREGRVPAAKIGRAWLFDEQKLVALVGEVSEQEAVRVTPADLREAGLSEKATDALWERLTAGRETG